MQGYTDANIAKNNQSDNSLNENIFRKLTDHLPIALYQTLKQPNGTLSFTYVSNAINELFELSPEEVLADDYAIARRFHPDDRSRIIDSVNNSLDNSLLWERQFRVILPKKGLRWIRAVAHREKLSNGCVLSNGYMEDITEQKTATDWIKYLSSALMNISESVVITNKDENIIYTNKKFKELHGYEGQEFSEKNITISRLNLDSEQRKLEIKKALEKGQSYFGKSYSRRKDGSTFFCEYSVSPIKVAEQDTYISVQRDITEAENMKRQIENENERYITTLMSVGEGVISTDRNGTITVINPLASKMTEWLQIEALGINLDEVLELTEEQTGNKCKSPTAIVLDTKEIYMPDFDTILVSKSGNKIPVEIIAAPIKKYSGEISGVVIVIKDFTEHREKQREIEFLSYHDYLTGLYNRRYSAMAIQKMDTEENLPLTMISLDVNGLKLTNDAFGHSMGDRLLCVVADILRDVCRKEDVIARLGGDEFSIIMPKTSAKDAELIKKQILNTALTTKLDKVFISLAIGYSVKSNVDEDIKDIAIQADNFMYKEKYSQGKTMRNQTINAVIQTINTRFVQEEIHTNMVSLYCYMIAEAFDLSNKEKDEVKIAGMLHDIGKITIPPEVLNKTGKLSKEEFETIKKHPEIGYQILRSVDEYFLISKYVLYHHERWDGTGYPEGLKGEEIPFQSRIIAVADSYEAMTAKRVYQKTKTIEEAKAELVRCSGTQFDPEIVKVFLDLMPDNV